MYQEEQNLIVSEKNSGNYIIMIIYLPSVPGAVSAINIGVLNTSAVRITWSPVEEANGNITHYIVTVSFYEGRELYNKNISVSSDLQVIVNGFGECIFLSSLLLWHSHSLLLYS